MAITFPTSGTTTVATSSTSAVSGSFSPAANTLLIAYVWTSENDSVTVTNSGTARTWTQRARFDGSLELGTLGSLYIFTASNPTALTSITVTAFASVSQQVIAVKPTAAAGVDLAAPVGDTTTEKYDASTTSFSRNLIVSTVNNSRSICIGTDWADSEGVSSSDGVVTSFIQSPLGSGIALAKSASTPTSGTTVSFSFIAEIDDGVWGLAAIELLPENVTQSVTPLAITTGETFGTAKVNLSAPVSGIASGETFGTPQVNLSLTTAGIASGEAFGTAIVGGISPTGIDSAEAFGTPVITYQQTLTIEGILSGESVGTPEDVFLGHPQDLLPEAIESLERVMEPVVRLTKKLVLRPPTIQETPAGPGVFFSRFGIHRGISILRRQDGSYYTTRFPAQTELEEMAAYYMGGHVHTLTVDEAEDLTEAGYGSYITLDDNDS